ncbi:MAG: ribonuclease P protein component [Bacteroidales bacterium]|nr:ribonuclease P protein component [Bacteroidales bacterium]
MPTFRKKEHLCSTRRINQLFAEGERLMVFPFSVRWMLVDDLSLPAQVMIVVPKRKLRHAVNRNRTRRLIRECYRQSKQPLYDTLSREGLQLVWSIVYVHGEVMPFKKLSPKFTKLMATLCKTIQSAANPKKEETQP